MEDEGSVLKYMTKSEIEEQRSSLLIMTQRLFVYTRTNPKLIGACEQKDDFVRQAKISRVIADEARLQIHLNAAPYCLHFDT